MILLENRGLLTFLSVFIVLPLLLALVLMLADVGGAWGVGLYLLAFTWLGTGLVLGSGYIAGEA